MWVELRLNSQTIRKISAQYVLRIELQTSGKLSAFSAHSHLTDEAIISKLLSESKSVNKENKGITNEKG